MKRAAFFITYPLILAAYKWRSYKARRGIVPRRWLSPSEVISEDLNQFEPRDRIDFKLIEDFAKARDDILGLAKKQIIFSGVAFAFLLSNYLGIGLDISVAGFSLRQTSGVPEGLLLVSNMLSCYTLILQSNAAVLDATIRSAVAIAIPVELRNLYLIRYFPHEQFGRYQPFNMPYLIPSRLHRAIGKTSAVLFLILLIFTGVAFAACNLFLSLHYLWLHPSFGIWSNVMLLYILTLGLGALFYVVLTRFKLPYLDYTVNDELELLKQIDPARYSARLQEIYGPLNADRKHLEQRGYLKPTSN
ncbi:putative small secreted protein [Bradyrhizobium elkanii]|uniref:hypothetical protein n=1 Tax=Bradyrhizobium elkanii TaxID=29448 RepID=UPI002167C658|nr:hypothetical protein [Bradyrhizobium elkanii]MCS3449102.1 putative small secreted protein [Bradyrhizobium elkanii]MCS3559755.1 putative small secreted protein [Bradyrhizobium elkanii]MCW2150399.1 putative small secreted protein [Bradyrhizobium elkanii]MCW2374130.1 putative small secreted protein [Bradyrhizobium elkanii]